MTKLLCILLSTLSALCPALCDDQVIRNANGRIVATISETANGHTIRNCDGKIIGRIQDTANGKTVRDENERIIGMIRIARLSRQEISLDLTTRGRTAGARKRQ